MIKQLTVKNWKSFEETTFYVDPLTILIGANASGKSNLLDVFLFLYRISVNVGISQAETLNLRKEVVDGLKKVLSEFQSIFVFDPIPSHMRDYKPFSDTLQSDGSNIAGVLAGLEKQRKKEVEETLTRYLKDLPERDVKRVWAEPVGKFKNDAMLYCEEGWGRQTQEVDARGMSDGTLRYLAIVTALLTRKEDGLLIIEEIDNGLHPARAGILIDMLKTLGKKRQIDIVVTTHSPALLDAAGNTIVPFITVVHRDDKTGVSILTPLEEIDQLPKLMAGQQFPEPCKRL